MQPKVHRRKSPLCEEFSQSIGMGLQLPFRCPRCGEQKRFQGLSSLRAHLEHIHSYCTSYNLNPDSPFCVDDVLLDHRKARDSSCIEKYRSQSVEMQSPMDSGRTFKLNVCPGADHTVGFQDKEKVRPPGVGCATELLSNTMLQQVPMAVHVQRRLEEMLRAANSTVDQQMLSTKLGQTEQAHSQHLAQQNHKMLEQRRALNQLEDVAAMVMALLREQLTESERELERRKREIISIHQYLEAVVQHKACGKVKLHHFIENLLLRTLLAERLLEYYRSDSSGPRGTTQSKPHKVETELQRLIQSRW